MTISIGKIRSMIQPHFDIEKTLTPDENDLHYLAEKLYSETKQYGIPSPFGFFIRDESGKLIAGCNGTVLYGKIYTDQLWVDPKYRHQGLARQLMTAVHEYGREMGCTMASISTMNFQNAVGFYQKLGYHIDLERKGHTKGSSCYFMKADL